MAFVERLITVNFGMEGSGANNQASSLSFAKHRVKARIQIAQGHWNAATVEIFGMSLAHMNSLTTIPQKPLKTGKNSIEVLAGDEINGMTRVYYGTIIRAWPDMQAAPEVPLRVDMTAPGGWTSVNPVDPTSFNGPTPVKTAHAAIAKKLGVTPESNGITAVLDSPYFWGPAYSQMQQLGKMARLNWVLEKDVCAAWPQGGTRQTSNPTLISKETGMVGYPMADPGGIMVKSLFKKNIAFGSTFTVQSDITVANGTWSLAYLELELESMMPHGQWFMTLHGVPIGQ